MSEPALAPAIVRDPGSPRRRGARLKHFLLRALDRPHPAGLVRPLRGRPRRRAPPVRPRRAAPPSRCSSTCAWGLVRLGRYLVRRLLWRIRSKLLVSYLFIAVVPVVLLLVLFTLAGVLFSGLVASHIVTSEVGRSGGAPEAPRRRPPSPTCPGTTPPPAPPSTATSSPCARPASRPRVLPLAGRAAWWRRARGRPRPCPSGRGPTATPGSCARTRRTTPTMLTGHRAARRARAAAPGPGGRAPLRAAGAADGHPARHLRRHACGARVAECRST